MAIINHACVIKGHENDVNAIDICGSQLASGSSDRTVRVFEIKNENGLLDIKEILGSPLKEHELNVTCVRFHCPYMLLSCSIDGTVILWKTKDKPCIISKLSQEHDGPLRCLSTCLFSDSIGAAGDGGIITLWKGIFCGDVKFHKSLEASDDVINTISFTSDGEKLISGSSDGTIRLWDTEFIHHLPLAVEYWAHEFGVVASDIQLMKGEDESSNYILATGGKDDIVKIWKIGYDIVYFVSLKFTCKGHKRSVNGVKFSHQHSFLVSVGDDQKVFIWDSKTGLQIYSFEPPHERPGVLSCAVEGDLIVTGSSDRTMHAFKFTKSNIPCCSSYSQLHPTTFLHWSTFDVKKWISDIGMEKYAQVFFNCNVSGFHLYHMNKTFLESILHITIPEHRAAILNAIETLKSPRETSHEMDDDESTSPAEFFCPITKEVMKQPVVASDGFSYEQSALKKWFDEGNCRSPVTNVELENLSFFPNYNLMSLIAKLNN